MKRLSLMLLKAAEFVFLQAHGWKLQKKDHWSPPDSYDDSKKDRLYRGGHAVNSQKYNIYHMPLRQRQETYGD